MQKKATKRSIKPVEVESNQSAAMKPQQSVNPLPEQQVALSPAALQRIQLGIFMYAAGDLAYGLWLDIQTLCCWIDDNREALASNDPITFVSRGEGPVLGIPASECWVNENGKLKPLKDCEDYQEPSKEQIEEELKRLQRPAVEVYEIKKDRLESQLEQLRSFLEKIKQYIGGFDEIVTATGYEKEVIDIVVSAGRTSKPDIFRSLPYEIFWELFHGKDHHVQQALYELYECLGEKHEAINVTKLAEETVDRQKWPQGTSSVRYSDDFTTLTIGSLEYPFSIGQQTDVIRILVQHWEKKPGFWLSQQTIAQGVDRARAERTRPFRMTDVFRKGHHAMGTIIESRGDGCYRFNPDLAS